MKLLPFTDYSEGEDMYDEMTPWIEHDYPKHQHHSSNHPSSLHSYYQNNPPFTQDSITQNNSFLPRSFHQYLTGIALQNEYNDK